MSLHLEHYQKKAVDLRETSFIVPIYNEQTTLPELIVKLRDFISDKSAEVVFVDDGSTDGTSEILMRVQNEENCKVITHKYNKGYGAAIKSGVRAARGNIVLFLDGDGQHRIEDIKPIIEAMKDNDMVIGDRSRSQKLNKRSPGKWFLKKTAEFLTEQSIPDINSGLRAVRRELFMDYIHLYPNGYSLTTTISLTLLKEGYNVAFVPIVTSKRKTGVSEVNYLKDGMRTLLLIFRSIVLFNPMKVFAPMSLILLVVGGIYSIWHIITTISMPKMGIVFVLTGVNIFFFGLLADQLSLIRREMKKRD